MYLILFLNVSVHSCYIGSKVVLALAALDLGASPVVIGFLVACYGVVPMLLGVVAGRLADTVGMRWPMLCGAASIALAMLAGYLWHALGALFLIATLVGAGFVFFNTSIQNLTGAISRPETRARSFSTLSVGYSLSNFAGPMIAGYTIEYAGAANAFLIFAVIMLFPLAALMLGTRIFRAAAPQAAAGSRSALDLLRSPPLARVIVVSGLIVASWEIYTFYVPIFAHTIGLPASMIGIILGAYAAATFLVRFAMPVFMKRLRVERMLTVSVLVAACAFLVFPFVRDPYALVAMSFVIGLGLGCGQPLSMTMAFDRSPPGRTGEVTGLRLIANNVARSVVPVVSGALGAAFGMAPVFWLNALNLLAVSRLSRK